MSKATNTPAVIAELKTREEKNVWMDESVLNCCSAGLVVVIINF